MQLIAQLIQPLRLPHYGQAGRRLQGRPMSPTTDTGVERPFAHRGARTGPFWRLLRTCNRRANSGTVHPSRPRATSRAGSSPKPRLARCPDPKAWALSRAWSPPPRPPDVMLRISQRQPKVIRRCRPELRCQKISRPHFSVSMTTNSKYSGEKLMPRLTGATRASRQM